MNRRRFFEAMLAAAATPPTYVFFGSFWRPQAEMIIAPFGSYPGLTVAEWAKRARAGPIDQRMSRKLLNRRRGGRHDPLRCWGTRKLPRRHRAVPRR